LTAPHLSRNGIVGRHGAVSSVFGVVFSAPAHATRIER
jgi:hypothetical protein